MRVSYNWIKQFINIPHDIDKHTALLTSLGLEVEGVEKFESVKGGLQGVVVGHVETCEKHPNADKLKITTVNLGEKTVQIVCGAPNVEAGQKVPVATIGTVLYDDKGEAWKIKKGKIRGEESHGMICAEDELGLGESHDGILVLDDSCEVGTPLSEIYKIEQDHVIEIGLTPNRADAMSHMGVARDLRAGLAVETGELTEFITPSVSSFHVDDRTLRIDVEVENPEKAPRYCGVTLTGLQVKESPEWLKNRLKAIGLAPKNNIVDITNYVMHELGQPLHAFDANKITGNKIIVKTVEKDTPFITLDGVEHKLHEEDLMICDDQKPLCIAGVYGGENSGVTEGTTSIFLESAYFDPVSVRKTAKRHGFNTDASFRFERGIDPNITEYALKRAVTLIEECAGGHVSSDIVDHYPVKLEDHEVYVTFEQINNLIGQEIPREEITTILSSLEINVNHATDAGIGLTVPAYRNDVTRPADVIEEILRVYGYDRIEVGTKLNATIATTSRKENNRIQNIAAQQLVGLGFYEMMANSLTAEKYHHLGEQISADNEVRMLNPLSSDLAVMRQSLIYGGLEAIAYNINRRQEDLKLFEFGKSYHQYSSGQFTEQQHLTLFTTGNVHSNSWIGGDQPADFFYLKGAVTAVLNRLGITTLNEKATKLEFLGEGISLNSGAKIADLGVISKKFTREFGIDQTVHYANIYWDEVIKLVQTENKPITSIPKFPVVQRDFALLVNDEVSFKELQTVALNAERKLLKEVKLFDVYQGKNLPAGKKSYALSFSLLDENKTLTDKQIDKVMNKIQQSLEKQTGAVLR